MKLRERYFTVPPGGWQFKITEAVSPRFAGRVIKGFSPKEIGEKLSRLLHNNGEPFDEDVYVDELCKQIPPEFCVGCLHEKDNTQWDTVAPLTWFKIYKFFMTMGNWLRKGHRFVEPAQAKERFEVCRNCPHSTRMVDESRERCISCSAEKLARTSLLSLIKPLGEVDDNPEQPLYCKLCGCELRAKVWFDVGNDCWNGVDSNHQKS